MTPDFLDPYGTAETRWDALRRIEREGIAGGPPPVTLPRKLSLMDLHLEPVAFQLRQDGPDGSLPKSAAHTKALGRAMATAKGQLTDDRIAVWWSGARWIVVDGHHRIAAYWEWAKGAKQKALKLDVEVVPGNLNDALKRTARENTKARLPTTQKERLDRAWLLVVRGAEGSVRDLAEATAVGKSTINTMRTTKAVLRSRGWPDAQMIETEWEVCDRVMKGRGEMEPWEVTMNAMAQQWQKRLGDTFGAFPSKSPETFALALRAYSEEMVIEMIRAGAWEDLLEEAQRRDQEEAADDDDAVTEG